MTVSLTVGVHFRVDDIAQEPTASPTAVPTQKPSARPSRIPTARPSIVPTAAPTIAPTRTPTRRPTPRPTPRPTRSPTEGQIRRRLATAAGSEAVYQQMQSNYDASASSGSLFTDMDSYEPRQVAYADGGYGFSPYTTSEFAYSPSVAPTASPTTCM
jgi:hypothetical protein